MPWLALIGLVLTALVLILFMVIARLKRRINRTIAKALLNAWNHAVGQSHPTMKIVEADKILDEALRVLGFSGSLGDKLKASGALFSNVDAVWKAHKLRNTLVHDLQKKPTDSDVDEAMRSYRQALRDLGVND